MLVQADNGRNQCAHVVVIGNEKGGSGKSTIAIHVALALMQAGQRVATIDLDSRQKTLTHYVDNRRAWAKRGPLALNIPDHYCVARREGIRADENEIAEFNDLIAAVAAVEGGHDFVVIDTPGMDSYLTRLAHAMADTLITPLNDSFVDFDVLGAVDPVTYALTDTSHYSEMVREARRSRREVDLEAIDWIVVRNRLATARSSNRRRLAEALDELGLQLGFRCAEGLANRVIYRELFARGLTALDNIDKSTLGTRPTRSHLNARQEVQSLLGALKLPIDERGRRRAAARTAWFVSLRKPLDIDDVIAG